MSLQEILQIGDEVVIRVPSETMEFTGQWDDINGRHGVVCGFYDAVTYEGRTRVLVREPGTYYSRGVASVWLTEDGRIVNGSYAEMLDDEEKARRDAAIRDANGVIQREKVRLGDLPPTPFWEEDRVFVKFPSGKEEEMIIDRIDYARMHDKRNNGSPWPFYNVRTAGGSYTGAEESWIELIERGPVWKFYHDEPLEFESIEEEAYFFQSIGHTVEVRNPKNDLYSWTLEEVIEAIRKGIVHGYSLSNGLFGARPSISARRFRDEELGIRVAKATLEGHAAQV